MMSFIEWIEFDRKKKERGFYDPLREATLGYLHQQLNGGARGVIQLRATRAT